MLARNRTDDVGRLGPRDGRLMRRVEERLVALQKALGCQKEGGTAATCRLRRRLLQRGAATVEPPATASDHARPWLQLRQRHDYPLQGPAVAGLAYILVPLYMNLRQAHCPLDREPERGPVDAAGAAVQVHPRLVLCASLRRPSRRAGAQRDVADAAGAQPARDRARVGTAGHEHGKLRPHSDGRIARGSPRSVLCRAPSRQAAVSVSSGVAPAGRGAFTGRGPARSPGGLVSWRRR